MMTAKTKTKTKTKTPLPDLPVGSKLNPDTAVRIPKGATVRTNDPNRPEGSYVTSRPQMVEAEIVELPGAGRVARWKARGGHYVGESATFEALTDAGSDARLAAAAAALVAVRGLHQVRRLTTDGFTKVWCRECKQDWPCPTFTAAGGVDQLNGETG